MHSFGDHPAPAQSVSFVIPLTITVEIRLGQPVIDPPHQAQAAIHCHHVGVNWDWGWYAYCSGCGCNRHLVLSVEAGPRNAHMAYCNVCRQTVYPPMDGARNAVMHQMDRNTLEYQRQRPNETEPKPLRT